MKTQIMNLFRTMGKSGRMEKSGEMGKSLKSLKSLMQIFATFATSASAIFVGEESCKSTVRYALWSRISLTKPLLNPYSTLTRFRLSLGSNLSRFSLASLICLCMLTVGVGNALGAVLFHETFGDNSGSARVWNDTYKVQSGVSTVYSGASYTISNFKQSKNTAGSTASGLLLSTTGTDAVFEVGPLNVSSYESLAVSFQYKAGSVKGTYDRKLYYKTSSSGSWTSVSISGTKATSFNLQTASLPAAVAGISTLYLKVICQNNKGQDVFDEFELTGTAAAATPSLTPDPTSLSWGTVLQGSSQSTKSFDISGANLTGNLSVAVTGGYSVSCGSSITVTSGTPTVSTITVTPPSTSTTGAKNGKVTISGGGLASNVEVDLSMTVNAASTVTWMNNGSEYTTTLVANGSKPEFPSNPSSCDGTSTTFVGWTPTPWSGKLDDVSDKTIYTSGSAMPNVSGPVTYHAVFAKVTANTYKKGTKADLTDGQTVLIVNSSNSYAMSSNTGSSSGRLAAVSVTISADKITKNDATLVWTVETSSSNYKFKQGTKYLWANSSNNQLYASSSYEDEWSVTAQSSHYIIHNVSVNKDLEYYSPNFTTYNTGTGVPYQMDFYIPDYSQYLTTCCTALGSVNGSITLNNADCTPNQLKATWKMSATTGIASQVLHIYKASDDSEVTGSKITGISASTSNQTQTISGLDPCTAYYVKVENISSGGEYCGDGFAGEKSSNVTTNAWGVTEHLTYTTHTTGAATACPGGNYVATYTVESGYVLPSDITLTIGGASKTKDTHYTWSVSGDVGTLTILAANITNSAGAIDITITSSAAAYQFWYGPSNSGDGWTATSFTDVGNNEWQITNFVIPAYEWDGAKQLMWNVTGSGISATNREFYALAFAQTQHNGCGDYNYYNDGSNKDAWIRGAGPGAKGTLRIYDNKADNGWCAFIPNEYVLKFGTSEVLFTETSANVWETAITDLSTLNGGSWTGSTSYRVGVGDASHAFVAVSNKCAATAASAMGYKTNAGDNWATGLNNIPTGRGKFRIWINNCTNGNWECHFVPYHRVVFHSNYPGGGGPADTYAGETSVEESNASIALASAPTAPTGYHFIGWYDAAEGGNLITTARSISAGASANIDLYAHWSNQTAITLSKGAQGTTNGSAVGTYGSNTVGSFTAVTYGGTTYRLKGYSKSGTPSEIVIDASGNFVANTTYTDASGNWKSSEAAVTLVAQWQAGHTITWSANGETYATTFVDAGNTLVLPDGTPTSCDAGDTDTYLTFIGWYSTAAGTNSSPTASIGSCGTQATTSIVPDANQTYYAVWGDGGLSADDVKQVTLNFTSNTNWQFPENSENKIYSTTENSYTSGDYTIKVAGDGSSSNGYYFNTSNNYFFIGKSGAYIKLPAFGFVVSKINVTTTTGMSTSTTYNIYSGTNAASSAYTGRAGSGHDFVISDDYDDIGTIYQLQVTNAYNLQVTNIDVYSPGAAATGFISSCCASPAVVSVTPTSSSLELDIDGQATTSVSVSQSGGGAGRYYPPTVTPSATGSTDWAGEYKTSAYSVNFTATAAGTYTVKAPFRETSYGCDKTGSATITVAANPILTPSSNSVAIDATCGLASSATDITVNSRYLASTSITASVATSTGTGSFKISSDNSSFDTSNKTITGGTSSKATSHIYVRYDATEGQTGSATGTLTLTCGEKVVNIPLSATVTCSAHVVLSSESPIQITAANGIWVEAASVVTVTGSYLTTNPDNANVSIRAYTDNAHFQIKTGGTAGEGAAKTSQGNALSLATNVGTASWNGSIGIVYKPGAHNTTETATLTVEVYRYGGSSVYDTKTYTLEGRSLPENFVIAVTDGSGNWFAVPADMIAPWGGTCSSGLSTYTPYPIEVDDVSHPTAVSGNTPLRAVYTAAARTGNVNTNPQTLSFKSVKLLSSGNYYLYGSSTNVDSDGSNTSLQNASFANSEKQKWFLDVVNWTNKEYNMHLASTLNTNVLAFTTAGGSRNIGQYAPNAGTTKKAIYILPASSTCDNYIAPENITCQGINATNYLIRFKPDRTKNYEVSLDGSSWSDVTTSIINECTDDDHPTLVEAQIPLATYRGQTVNIRVKAVGSCAESTTFDVPDPSLTVNDGTWLTMTGIAGYALENTENSVTISGLASCANTVNVAVSGANADKIGASINSTTGVVTISMTAANAIAGTYNAILTFTADGAVTRTQNITITIISYAPITISSDRVSDGYYCYNTATDGLISIDGGSNKICGYFEASDSYVALGSGDWGSRIDNKLYDITTGETTSLTRNAGSTDYVFKLNLAKSKVVVGHTYELRFNQVEFHNDDPAKIVYTQTGVPYQPTVFRFTVVDCSKPTALQACPIGTTSFTANWYDMTCAAANSTIKVMQAGDAIANVALGYSSSQHTLDVDGNTLTGTDLVKPQNWGYASSTGYYDTWLVSDQEYKSSKWQKADPAGTSNGIRMEKANDKAFVFTPRMGQLYPSVTTSTMFKVMVKAYYYSNTHSLQCFAIQTEPNWDMSPTSGVTATFNGVSTTSWTSSTVSATSGTYVTYSFTVSGLTSTTRLGFGPNYTSTAGMALSAIRIEPISEVKSVSAPCSTGSVEITGLSADQSYFYTVTNNGNTSGEIMVNTRKAAPSVTYFPGKVILQADVDGSVSQVVTFTGKNLTPCDVDDIIAASTKTGSSYFTVTPGDYTYDVSTGALSGSFTVTYSPTAEGTHTGTYSVGGVTAINLEGHSCPTGFGNMAQDGASPKDAHSATVHWTNSTTGTVMLAQGTRLDTELLSNGGFELGLAGWDESRNLTGDICTAVKRNGSNSRYCTYQYSADLRINGSRSYNGVYTDEMTFLPGTYHVEAYVRHAATSTTTGAFDAANNEFYIGISKDTTSKTDSYLKYTSVVANADYAFQFNNQADEWKKVYLDFTLKEKVIGRVFVGRKQTSTNVAYFFLDDVSLKMTEGGALDDKSMYHEAAAITGATSVALTGLKPQTTYSFYVVSESGCESNIATFTTDASADPITIAASPSPLDIAGPLGKTTSVTMNVTTTNAYANVIVSSGTCTDGRISISPTTLPADGGLVTVSFTPRTSAPADEMGDHGSCVLQLNTSGADAPTSVTVNWAVSSGFDESTPVVEVVDITNDGMNIEHNVTTTGEATVSIIINRETTEEEREENVGDEIFFSKYYEANQNVKLVAIFNPTDSKISLAGTYIWLARDAGNYWGNNEDNRLALSSYGKERGFIGPQEEIIFYRYESNVREDKQTIECAAGKTDMSEWNRVYNGVLSFSGNDALLLVRDTTVNDRVPPAMSCDGVTPLTWRYVAEYDISNKKVKSDKNFAMLDIIGARTAENYPSNSGLSTSWSWTNCKNSNIVEEGDGTGWYGYGKDLKERGNLYYNCGADPTKHGYLLSTNRCLLIRLKDVKSGSNAVRLNEGDFNTLDFNSTLEWQGAHVPEDPDRDEEIRIGCENFSFVGGYDYAGYYNKWTPVTESECLDGIKQPDGSYHIDIADGTPHYYCKTLCIQVAEKTVVNGVEVENVHVSQEYKVPIVVDDDATTADATVFRNADDVAPINTLTESICNECDVVIRDNAQLTHVSAGQGQFRTMTIYPGSKFDNSANQNFTLDRLHIQSLNNTVGYAIINNQDGGSITADTIIHTKRINDADWYSFTLPYDCDVATIRQSNGKVVGKYWDGTNYVDEDWTIQYYDGQARQAAATSASAGEDGLHWKYVSPSGTLKAGQAYIVGLFTTEWEGQHKTLYFPPKTYPGYTEYGDDEKTTTVKNWPDNLSAEKRHHGWNFTGSPYISRFGETTSGQGLNNPTNLILGKIKEDGTYEDETQVYVSIPNPGANTYTQVRANATTLDPFKGYFVQTTDPDNGVSNNLTLRYAKGNRALNAPANRNTTVQRRVVADLKVTDPNGQSDIAGIVVDDNYTPEYEIGGDLEKWFAKDGKPQLYFLSDNNEKMAYIALPDANAGNVPMELYAPQTGQYLIQLNERSCRTAGAECVELLYEGNVVANLLIENYTIEASKGMVSGYSVRIRRSAQITTSTELINGERITIITNNGQKSITNLPGDAQVFVYDMTGRLINYCTADGERVVNIDAPQQGVYNVVVQSASEKAAIKTIVR